MKRQIRCGVFETNSSSTHSLSIFKGGELKFSSIPIDGEVVLDDSYSFATDIYDEMGKLNFLVTIISTIVENRNCGDNKSFNEMITYKYFEWLKELIKEERNTDIKYKTDSKYFPYYETTYDENRSVEQIFSDNNKYDIDDKEQFKKRCKEIIFDKKYKNRR